MHFVEFYGARPVGENTNDCKFYRMRTAHSEHDFLQFKKRVLTAARADKPPFTFIAPVGGFSRKNGFVDFSARSVISIKHCSNCTGLDKPGAAIANLVEVLRVMGHQTDGGQHGNPQQVGQPLQFHPDGPRRVPAKGSHGRIRCAIAG